MSILIRGMDMPKKQTTVVIRPDGRAWVMSGGDRKLEAEELRGGLIWRGTVQDMLLQECEAEEYLRMRDRLMQIPDADVGQGVRG